LEGAHIAGEEPIEIVPAEKVYGSEDMVQWGALVETFEPRFHAWKPVAFEAEPHLELAGKAQ
jgi:hypothetical protein